MAISDNDVKTGVRVLRSYGATKIWLFGSAVETPDDARDLDLACEGVAPAQFFRAAGELIQAIGKPVDLVDLSEDTRLNRFVRTHARAIYDAR